MNTATAVMVTIIEDYFKLYLKVCEYLRLDPSVIYDTQTVTSRCDKFLSGVVINDEKVSKKVVKDVKYFSKHYQQFAGGGWRGYGFAMRCAKLAAKENIKIYPDTVCDELTEFTLTHKNYDYYAEQQKKIVPLAIAITVVILLVFGVIIALTV